MVNLEWVQKVRGLIDDRREEEALSRINKVLERNPSSKDALKLKAQIYETRNDHERSLRLYQTLISLYEAREDLEEQIEVLTSIGQLHHRLDQLEEAMEAFTEVLSKFDLLDRPLGDYLFEQKLFRLEELASIERDKGDLEASLETRKRMLGIHRSIGAQEGIIEDLVDIGDIYMSQGRYSEAKAQYKRALQESDDTEDNYMEPFITYNLGKTLFRMGDYAGALEHLEFTVNHFRQMEETFPDFGFSEYEEYTHGATLLELTAENLLQKAGRLVAEGQLGEARQLCAKLEPIEGSYEEEGKATLFYYLALLAHKEQHPSEAKTHLQKSIRTLKQMNSYRDTELYSKIKVLLKDMRAEDTVKGEGT